MAKKIQTAYDFTKNEIQNIKIHNLTSDPSSPVVGQEYFNTVSNKLRTWNGSTWDEYGTSTASGTVTGVSVVTANGFAGTVANSTTTPAITITATPSGILKSNGAAISAAASGTDYAPPTATTSSLKGNGSGGFSAATLNDNGAPTADFSMASHKLTNVTDPTSAQDAATKAYVDATAAGIDWKASVRAASTVNGTLATAYANGSIIDGVTLVTGDRILLKDQSAGAENGLYVVAASGAPTRASDADTSAEITGGLAVFVEEGTTYADTGWVMTNNGAATVGSTALVFTQFTGLGAVTAGTGLTKSGNTISLTNPVTIALGGTGVATLPTGLLKGAGTGAITAAVSSTDYAPATSGSNILKGNGSGGFSSAKFTATIGDGGTTAIGVTHSLGTQDVIAQVRDASTNAVVECDIVNTSTSVTTFTFTVAPASNAYKVVIIG